MANMIYQNFLKIIGNTPLIKINLSPKDRAEIYAKFEALNPSGSIKDRMALYMIEKNEKKGILKKGMTIIEATTGNTGIALAMIASVKKYKMIAVMPENMSRERKQLMAVFGAKIILTPAAEGPKGAINKRDELSGKIKNSWVPGQFENFDNVEAHEFTTAQEIIKNVNGRIDAFVTGVGTGGTLIGVAKALKSQFPLIKIIAVEPSESAVLSGEKEGKHNIQGIGEGFIPKLVDRNLIDEVEKVSTREAISMVKKIAQEEGALVGFSSGANLVASLRIAKKLGKGKVVVTILPDRGERYLSELNS